MDEDEGLKEASGWEGPAMGKTGSCSGGKAMISKSLIQFSVDGWGCVSSLKFGLRPSYGRCNGNLLQKDLCQQSSSQDCCCQYP